MENIISNTSEDKQLINNDFCTHKFNQQKQKSLYDSYKEKLLDEKAAALKEIFTRGPIFHWNCKDYGSFLPYPVHFPPRQEPIISSSSSSLRTPNNNNLNTNDVNKSAPHDLENELTTQKKVNYNPITPKKKIELNSIKQVVNEQNSNQNNSGKYLNIYLIIENKKQINDEIKLEKIDKLENNSSKLYYIYNYF